MLQRVIFTNKGSSYFTFIKLPLTIQAEILPLNSDRKINKRAMAFGHWKLRDLNKPISTNVELFVFPEHEPPAGDQMLDGCTLPAPSPLDRSDTHATLVWRSFSSHFCSLKSLYPSYSPKSLEKKKKHKQKKQCNISVLLYPELTRSFSQVS